ncbi:4-(cytidine 5'-diphospho)-2-C-methyl-D-erythritol kinase [Akkermansia glycaniphila]|uniref:4-(cytidine 5'-diphospho)-2-C-methyl-D-erythritol kinase n=1 Tax=Akkermansia glycaniphila TaxID=1679444 RepID=UPI001C012EFE|nr:4-(cytidine 5'-diphospho)-2-C-methyl-D-erythritol kinase [Akkermansia glycaniphila]
MMTVTAPAKINLSLRILGKREDGFHEIDTVMAPLDLADEIHFANSRTTTLLCDAPGVPTDESNLVMKAVRLFEREYGKKAKQKINLVKRIPAGAGLGGGSSDAVQTLLALNEIIGTGYSSEKMAALAAELGSDTSFFLHPAVSRCTGRGEQVEPLEALAGWTSPIVVLKPSFGIATPDAYRRWADSRPVEGFSYAEQNADGVILVNDLERPAFEKYPFLGMMKQWLLRQDGVKGALMSGSGSSMFALTGSPDEAQAIAQKAVAELDSTLFVWTGIVNPQ